ncbi:MAG: peptide deformylase [Desulfamplus sp.]|nr:peptide deformylase [Desulfamplus sp.]
MSKILGIAQLGCSVLREKSKRVEKLSEIKELINDSISTLIDSGGVGIASPQLYQPYRFFIMKPNADAKPIVVINPEIIRTSHEVIKSWESCLSIPGIRGLVSRYQSILVRYETEDENIEEKEISDFQARIFQHEYDHLDGLVYLDRLDNVKDIITEKEYLKIR